MLGKVTTQRTQKFLSLACVASVSVGLESKESHSLRSNRFCGVREQRKSEKRDFRCFARDSFDSDKQSK